MGQQTAKERSSQLEEMISQIRANMDSGLESHWNLVAGIKATVEGKHYDNEQQLMVILTAYDWSDIEVEAREAGVTAFVMKPLFMSELREVLTRPVRIELGEDKVTEPVDFTGKKILLVEDNELNQEIAVEILKEAGFIVDVADDGIVAVEKMVAATPDSYDLILMDVQMPRMNGFTATREIRTLGDNKKANIPIIAMTANAFDEDKKRAFEAGMNGFVAKPINIQMLMNTLTGILK